jgi:hypothetical protein
MVTFDTFIWLHSFVEFSLLLFLYSRNNSALNNRPLLWKPFTTIESNRLLFSAEAMERKSINKNIFFIFVKNESALNPLRMLDPNTSLTNLLIMNHLDDYVLRDWLDWLKSTCALDVRLYFIKYINVLLTRHIRQPNSLNDINIIYMKIQAWWFLLCYL